MMLGCDRLRVSIDFHLKYYPDAETDFYVDDTAGFAVGDIVEYDNDGVARIVASVTSDRLGWKVVVAAGDKIVGGIPVGQTLGNWKQTPISSKTSVSSQAVTQSMPGLTCLRSTLITIPFTART